MIKLTRGAPPAKLTPEEAVRLTQIFKETKKDVWNAPYIREAVLGLSNGKCCFSQIDLEAEANFHSIDHFHPKSLYPEEVVAWDNLLPSNSYTNSIKGEHDTKAQPIVNPFKDNPKDHLYMANGQYWGLDETGWLTISKTGLDRPRLTKPRTSIFMDLKGRLEMLCSNMSMGGITEDLIEKCRNLMAQGNRTEAYSAVIATTILEDHNFQSIEASIKKAGLWDATFEGLMEELRFSAMPKR